MIGDFTIDLASTISIILSVILLNMYTYYFLLPEFLIGYLIVFWRIMTQKTIIIIKSEVNLYVLYREF